MGTTIPHAATDLTEAREAVLATIGPDGRPQLSLVWFLYDDGRFRVSLNTTRQKVKNLNANPAVTLFVIGDGGMRYLEVRGDATLTPDPDYDFATRIGTKYGAFDAREMDGPDGRRVVLDIDPARVNFVDMTAAT